METPAEYATPQTHKSTILAILEDRPIASAQDIVKWSAALGYGTSGLYFLIDGAEIVYVGQSRVSILSRLSHHEATKKFDRVTIFQTPANYDLDTLEAEYIWSLCPKYNRKLPPNPYYEKIEKLRSLFHLRNTHLFRFIQKHNIDVRFGCYDKRDIQRTVGNETP